MEDILKRHLPLPFEIKYRTAMTGALDAAEISKNHTLLFEIRNKKSWLVQSDLKTDLLKIATDNEEQWALAGEKQKYAQDTAKQIRAMLRDISQSIFKRNAEGKKIEEMPDWLKPFASQAETIIQVPPQDERYKYGWDAEGLVAWRCHGKKAPEYALEMLVTGNPDAEVVGVWADGTTWAVPAMTEKEYEYQTQARAPQQVKHSLSWHGPHVKEGEVYIKKSTAKEKAWIIMWHHVPGEERPRQKMQIGVHGKPDKDQQDHEERVVEWMVALAQRFAAEDMSKETLQSLKDDFTHELDGPTKKRPAAASKSEPKAKAKAAAKPVPKAEPKRSCAKAAPKLVPKAEPKIKPLAAPKAEPKRSCAKAAPKPVPKAVPKIKPLAKPNRSPLPDLHLFGWDAGDYW